MRLSVPATALKRTLHGPERTEHTAIAGLGSHDETATHTLIKVQTAVCRNLFGMGVPACRAGDDGFHWRVQALRRTPS